MRPTSVVVTSSNTPYYIPTNWRSSPIGVTATPSGSGDYDVAYTHESIAEGADGVTNWTDITDMSAATTAQSKEIGTVTCLRITLNSGTSVKVDVVHSDSQ